MKKILKKSLMLLVILTMFGYVLSGCGTKDKGIQSTNEKDSGKEGTIKLVYVNWAEGIAMTNLAKVILEDKMGYTVELTMADVAPIFASLASGDQDIFMDAWLPITHESYMNKYGEEIEEIGVNFEGAKIGLVVPSYVNINSISELNDIKDKLNGDIIGIDSGAGIMIAAEKAIDIYGLDMELIPGSGPAMTAFLGTAIENEEPVVVTGWSPHWKFAKWDLKFLEDTENVFGDAEDIYSLARIGFSEEMPKAATFLANFHMDSQQLGDLMGAISESEEDPDIVARVWMDEHDDLIQSWISEE
ncbi:MAG TPA: glycine betaine ABC transporter substrate-binding protein [Lachnospiraceae bacterium]|nr:glycine betaine ABC transporter substrate-binding protein [Lachnospiraceae bacterium]